RFVEEDEPRSETAHRVQERIVRRDDADIGTIKRRDETDRVGQSGMIRDEEDRTASRNPIEAGDIELGGEMVQGPARRVGKRARREDLIARGELARDAAGGRTEKHSRDRSTWTSALPTKCLSAFAREDLGEQLDLNHRTPSTRRVISLSDGFAELLDFCAPRSSARIAVRVSRSSSRAASTSRVTPPRQTGPTGPRPGESASTVARSHARISFCSSWSNG